MKNFFNKKQNKAFKNGDAIAVIWDIRDVYTVAEDDGIDITDEQARGVLAAIYKNQDANEGITWDTIRNELSEVAG